MSEKPPGGAIANERYLVERTLGRGGMATVYLARDRMLDRPVALKVLAPHLADDDEFRERFVREARLVARFMHPNVVQVYDVGEDERGPFIVMEYVEGETLADELARRGRFPPADAVAVAIQLCAALQAAHGERLVHRDIKPQNVLRAPNGDVKVADFGIARSLAATRNTELGTVLGTATYLSPEQARGEDVTAAADLYSLGVVLYELLTGQAPFEADTLMQLQLEKERGAVARPSELAPGIPPALDAVVLRCLAARPEDRPASAAELARELASSVGESATEPLTPESDTRATEILPVQPRYPERNRRRIVAAAVLILVTAAGLAVALALSGGHAKPSAGASPPTTAPTTSATTAATTTAPTTTRQPSAPARPTTPAQAIAQTRTAIVRAENAGGIQPQAAQDLGRHLDDITKSIQTGKPADAGHKVADTLHHLGDLVHGRQLDSAAYSQLSASLQALARLLPATPHRK